MKIRHKIAAVISVPAGFAVTILFISLFAIDVATPEQLSSFPEGWGIMDLIRNSFVLLMFGGSVRAIYRGIADGWLTPPPPPDTPND